MKSEGQAKINSHLEQNLFLLLYRFMQIHASLVMIYRLPCTSLCLGKGNILANFFTLNWVSHGPTNTYALLKLVLPLADFIGNNPLSNQNWGTSLSLR